MVFDITGLFLTAHLYKTSQLVHVTALHIERRMNISVKSDIDVRMAENFAEAFYLKPNLHTSRGKSMPGTVKIRIFDPAALDIRLEAILIRPRLNIPSCLACKKICV